MNPDFYQGRLGFWHFHCDGYTSSPYHSYDAAKFAYAAWETAGRPGHANS